uniref:Uncharacterized protein n=1 Tax=Picea sitchensis TaxID=3332 RepID=D5ACP6_PICSI|nr:unknown [Picea sitchensis]
MESHKQLLGYKVSSHLCFPASFLFTNSFIYHLLYKLSFLLRLWSMFHSSDI